jgi:hypothetical protein
VTFPVVLQLQDIVGPGNLYSVKAVNQEVIFVHCIDVMWYMLTLPCPQTTAATMMFWLLQVNVILIAIKPQADGSKHSSQPYSRRDICQVRSVDKAIMHAQAKPRSVSTECS